MEQGVPVKRFDLPMYYDYHDGRARGWVQDISNFSDVLALVLAPPVESSKAMRSMWKTVARGPFVDNEDDRSDGDFFPQAFHSEQLASSRRSPGIYLLIHIMNYGTQPLPII